MFAVGEAFIEVALGQGRLAADGTYGQRRPVLPAEQLHAGGDQIFPTYGVAIFQRDAGPAASFLTGLHIAPKLHVTTRVVRIADVALIHRETISDSRYVCFVPADQR